MKIFIFINGKHLDRNFCGRNLTSLKERSDIVICADGGYGVAKSIGVRPDIVIGDLDSLNGVKIDEGIEVISFSVDKDYSDFELALNKAVGYSPDIVYVYGGLGGRIDHEITNIILLAYAKVNMVFIEKDVEIYNVLKKLSLKDSKGCTVSLLPIGGNCTILNMEGFKYMLHNEVLKPSSRGLSNVITKDEANIEIGDGKLIVVLNREID